MKGNKMLDIKFSTGTRLYIQYFYPFRDMNVKTISKIFNSNSA